MSGCFHCGAHLPSDPPQARIAGIHRAVCCHGCRAVAEWIADLGLADYYRLRRGVAATPPDAAEAIAEAAIGERAGCAYPALRARGDGTSEAVVLVEGIRCSACSWLIERTLSRIPGVTEVGVNVDAQRARLVFDPSRVSLARLVAALGRVGYRARPLDAAAFDDARRRETRDAQKRLAVAAIGAMQAMMYASALWFGTFDAAEVATRDAFRWLTLLAATPVVFYSAAPIFKGAWRLIRARTLGMDVPVALAVALIYGASAIAVVTGGPDVWFESASMFVFFLCAGRYLEMRARHRAGDLSDALARLVPAFAERVEADGTLKRVASRELTTADRVVVVDGARVPADGVLESATCQVDEALLSGESASVAKLRGDTLCAGSLVVGAPATMRVTRVGEDTVVAGVAALAARAATTRPRLARAGERTAAGLAAAVLLLAAGTALAWLALDPSRSVAAAAAVLVVACPCAFALAAPAAVARTLAVLSQRGVLVVRPDALEELAAATHVLYDKTGTLTEPALAEVMPNATRGVDSERALALAAALAQGSRHPLAKMLVAAARGDLPPVSDRDSVAGLGLAGTIGGVVYRLGRADFAAGEPHASADAVVLADAAGVLASFTLTEALKPDARDAVGALAGCGLVSQIVSGDAPGRVAVAARLLGIEAFAARCTPADKLAVLAALRVQGARVLAVGDGINDAPLLAAADVSVAVGSAAECALSASDIIVTGSLRELTATHRLAREMLVVVAQNRRWAVAYNVVAIPLAAMGLVPPWLAALGMSASSLAVVGNALRIGRAPTGWRVAGREASRAVPTVTPEAAT